MRNLDHPLLSYFVICGASLTCAFALFQIGGSLAELTGNEDSALGFGFKAGGGIAGFILIFVLSERALLKFYDNQRKANPLINVKVYLQVKPNGFDKRVSYEAEYTIQNEDTGDSRTVSTVPFWEAGFLTVLVRSVGESDYLTIRIRNSELLWESESFHSRSPKITELFSIN